MILGFDGLYEDDGVTVIPTPATDVSCIIRIDKAMFYAELLEGLICREYVGRFGPLEWDFKAKAIERYHNDPIFHTRVQHITGHIMMLLSKHKK